MITEKRLTTPLSQAVSSRDILQKSQTYLLQNYARTDLILERGNGVYLFDNDGERYLDCVSGLAVNALGHGDYDVLEAVRHQVGKLIHVSNLYHTIPGALLAEQLVVNSFADRVFFCNSGTEAIEACMKFARRWARAHYGNDKTEFVAMQRSFHGRTFGSLTLTGQEKYQAPFEPLVPSVHIVPFNDIDATVSAITDKTCAVFVEPVQAEGGIHLATPEFLAAVREACDGQGALLVFDEIQVGLGRTGKLFCHQHFGVEPDMMTLAKPLAGGLPIGAALVRQHIADAVQAGDHAATFGGGPLVCAAALTVFEKLVHGGLVEDAARNGAIMERRLREMQPRHRLITDVRGMGLIWGVELAVPAAKVVAEFRRRHVLVCPAGPNVLRFLPPLVIGEEQLHQVADMLDDILTEMEQATD